MNASQHSGEELLQNNRDSPNLSLPSIYEGRNSSTPMTIENVRSLGPSVPSMVFQKIRRLLMKKRRRKRMSDPCEVYP